MISDIHWNKGAIGPVVGAEAAHYAYDPEKLQIDGNELPDRALVWKEPFGQTLPKDYSHLTVFHILCIDQPAVFRLQIVGCPIVFVYCKLGEIVLMLAYQGVSSPFNRPQSRYCNTRNFPHFFDDRIIHGLSVIAGGIGSSRFRRLAR